MAYQYPPQGGGYPQQPQQPQYPQQPQMPQQPQAPQGAVGMNVGGVGFNVPVPGGADMGKEMAKLGFFGQMTFYGVAGLVGFALIGFIMSTFNQVWPGRIYTLAGYLGQASLVLLGLTIVTKLIDAKDKK